MSTDDPAKIADRLVHRAAVVLTRRRALRNAGGAALSSTLAAVFLTSRASIAEACTFSTVCGPSPLCSSSLRCDGYNCKVSSTTKWRKHDQFVCGTASDINCWTACSAGGNLWRCCDCAGSNTGGCGEVTTGCGSGTWRACICHAVIGSC